MARDDFNKSVIDKLKGRVAHRCSNPSCRVPTSSPSTSSDGVNNIGVAAHVCAASPGGPRYDESMTVKERTSIDNAIWLCSNCAADIDRDVKRYTVEVLKKWKQETEKLAREELGKTIPDAKQAIDTVTTALTGLPTGFIPNAIDHVHQATEKSLEALDERFFIKTSYKDGTPCIGVHAKEDVPLELKIESVTAREYIEKHRMLEEHGQEVEIGSEGVSISGSPLFEEIFRGKNGLFQVLPQKKRATQKLWLVQDETQAVETFDDVIGWIVGGTKSFTFNGTACGDIFKFKYQKLLDMNDSNVNVSFAVHYDKWEGQPLNSLPYLEKLFSLLEKMNSGWKLFTSLEIEGNTVMRSNGIAVDKWDYVSGLYSLLHYIKCCKCISSKLNHDIKYKSDVNYTADEHEQISNVVDVIEGRQTFTAKELTSNASCVLVADEEAKNVKMLQTATEPTSIKFTEQVDVVTLFGNKIILPPRVTTLHSVLPKIIGDAERLKSGDEFKVEWMPQKDFKCIVTYEPLDGS